MPLNKAPIQDTYPISDKTHTFSSTWSQWFLNLYSPGTWTPTFTNLTVVNGTGGATYSGKWTKLGDLIFWTVQITVTGTATTASAAGTTFINNLPYTSAVAANCTAANGVGISYGVGIIPITSITAYTPTWSAYNGSVTITGWYPT